MARNIDDGPIPDGGFSIAKSFFFQGDPGGQILSHQKNPHEISHCCCMKSHEHLAKSHEIAQLGDGSIVIYGGFHSHRGTPNWMVYFMDHPVKTDDNWVITPTT